VDRDIVRSSDAAYESASITTKILSRRRNKRFANKFTVYTYNTSDQLITKSRGQESKVAKNIEDGLVSFTPTGGGMLSRKQKIKTGISSKGGWMLSKRD